MKKKQQYYVRKAHRWLGIIIGVQFIFWTVSGLYFSWTDIDRIHGDHFLVEDMPEQTASLGQLPQMDSNLAVKSISLRFIDGQSYFWLNGSQLIHTETGELKEGVTKEEARSIARANVKPEYTLENVKLLTETGPHHEYRDNVLPAWAIQFEGPDRIVVYVAQRDGSFRSIRHSAWRWFDDLWMLHTMDYQTRDNFNTFLLRAFSLFGLVTVASGFWLFRLTWRRKGKNKNQRKS